MYLKCFYKLQEWRPQNKTKSKIVSIICSQTISFQDAPEKRPNLSDNVPTYTLNAQCKTAENAYINRWLLSISVWCRWLPSMYWVVSVVLSDASCHVIETSNHHAFVNIHECVSMTGISFREQAAMNFTHGHDASGLCQETLPDRK